MFKCPECSKKAGEQSSFNLGSFEFVRLTCGHMLKRAALVPVDGLDEPFDNGKTLFDFQKTDGVKFIEQSGGRTLVNFEMGLGKTFVVFGFIRSRTNLINVWVVKAALIKQLTHEIITNLGVAHTPQVLTNGEPLLPVKHYIISYDTLWRLSDARLMQIKARCNHIILDECQLIKDMSAKRSKGVHKFVKDIPYVTALSGTPIKNHAGEFYSILHLLRPEKFPTQEWFMSKFVDYYLPTGRNHFKIGGIRNYDSFKEYTKEFIIRKTRAEVMPDLPRVSRNFLYIEPDQSANLTDMYDEAFDEFETELSSRISSGREAANNSMHLLGMMAKLRHVTGLMKIKAAIDFITQFLLETDRKIILFCHHKDVAEMLLVGVNRFLEAGGYLPAEYIAPGFDGNAILGRLKTESNRRVAVASQLHAGEGYNMQFLADILMVERQWNPANEEQCEDRIARIGQLSNKLTATYIVAVQTIDEMLCELVERKRHNIRKSYGEIKTTWNENSLMKELADLLMARGKPKWKL